jgi:hypothetical protein
VLADVELTSIVADDHGIGEEPMLPHRAPSVVINTGSGLTLMAEIPSPSR